MKKIIIITIICTLTSLTFSQNFGIDTPTPAEKLDVNGNIALRGIKLAAFFKNPLSGGGDLTWQSNVLSWTQRIIAIPAGDAGSEHLNTAPWQSGPQSVTIGAWNVAYMRPSDADLSANGGSYNPIQVTDYGSYNPEIGDVIVAVHNGDNGMLYTGWGVVMPPNSTFTSDGRLVRNTRPAFSVSQVSMGNPGGGAVITYNTTVLNQGGHMNLGTGYFQAPVTGIYHFAFHGFKQSGGGTTSIVFRVNGSNQAARCYNDESLYSPMAISTTVHLTAGQTVGVWVEHGALHGNGSNQFSGFLVE